MVYASSSAWVGCSWVPSPALTTDPSTQSASRCGAPEAGCRTTTASAPMACRVSAVSFRLSPLATLEPLAREVDHVGAESLGGRLERDPGPGGVLVEEVDHGPPAQRGQLLDLPAGDGGHLGRGVQDQGGGVGVQVRAGEQVPDHASVTSVQPDLVVAVGLGEGDLDVLGQRGRDVLADVVGADRQLTVTAVDQDGELHGGRAADVAERVQRGPHGAAGEEHVVDQDHPPAVDPAAAAARSGRPRGWPAGAGRRGKA